MSAYSLRLPAHQKYGTDLSMGPGYTETCCNWSSSQEGQMLAIYLARPACSCLNGWNAYGGTRVGPLTALCKADYNCPAGLAVHANMLRAQKRFAEENARSANSLDRHAAQKGVSLLRQYQKRSSRVNVYFAFLRIGARPRPILPPLTVQEVSFLLSQSELVRPRTQLSRIASACPK